MNAYLNEDECVQDLQRGGLHILQKKSGFRFGTDAVLLADFCAGRLGRRAADMGTGTGVIALLCCARNPRVHVDAFEVQKEMADMARRSVGMNGLEARICVHEQDVRLAPETVGYEKMDAVFTNPPYNPRGTGLSSPYPEVALSREMQMDIETWVGCCGKLVRFGGRFFAVYPASRLAGMLRAMEMARLTPKRIRFVCACSDRPPKLFLVEGIKGAGEGLLYEPALYTHDAEGPTLELRRIYGEMD